MRFSFRKITQVAVEYRSEEAMKSGKLLSWDEEETLVVGIYLP